LAQFSQSIARMPEERSRVSLAQLVAEDVALDPGHVAAIVRQLSALAPDDDSRRAPAPLTPGQVWIEPSGAVTLTPGARVTVRDLGDLMEILLLAPRRAGPARIPPGLLIATARAIRLIDAPPFASPAELSAALARFEPQDARGAIQTLVARWAATHAATDADEQPDAVPLDVPEERPPLREERREAPEPEQIHAVRRGWLRPLPLAGMALAGLAAAAIVAVSLNSTRVRSDRSEVATSTPPPQVQATTGETSRPREPEAPAAEVRKPETPAPAATASAPRKSAETEPATEPEREPKPLIDPQVVTADAVFSPSFASNGSAVFFHAQTSNASVLKRADRGEEGVLHVTTIVDDGARNYHVQLAPDGQAVAFDSDRDGVRGVYVARPDGTNVRRVSGEGYSAVPTWSPDSRRLALIRAEPDRPKVWNLWVMDVSSGEMTRLTNHRYGQVWGGTWFPDGRSIGYSHEDRLIVLDMASGRSTIYASPRKGQLVRTPAVSPDGRWMVFQVLRDGAWLLELRDGSMQRVLDDPSAEEFTWAPDGRRVAFHSRRNGEWGLWIMSPR
jgi:hypothetical protein